MARPFEQITSDRLQIREGGGCMSAFGLPFFAAGVFIVLSLAGVIPISNASEMGGWGWLAMAFMGLVFTGVGCTLVFGRIWTILDVTRRLVIKQWGLAVPLRERTYPLAGYSAVTLGFVRGDSDTADRFPIGLKAQNGPGLPLCSFTTYATSRECAIAVARHLHLEVEDSTTDHPVRVTPAHAERPLRERAIEFTYEGATAQPVDARSTVTREPDGVRIDIPVPRMSPIGAFFGLTPLIIPIIAVPWLMNFFSSYEHPRCHRVGVPGAHDLLLRPSAGDDGRQWHSAIATRRHHRFRLAARNPDSGTRCVADALDSFDRCIRHP